MSEELFEEIKSELGLIQTDTAWIWHNFEQLKKVNTKLESIEELLIDNNQLLTELIRVTQAKK